MGLRIDTLQSLLRNYEDEFGVDAYLIDEEGNIYINGEILDEDYGREAVSYTHLGIR